MSSEPLLDLAAEPRFDGRVRKLVRLGLAQRASALAARGDGEAEMVRQMNTAALDGGSVHANRQHYEVPPQFFRAVLGPHLKYSCCLWPEGGGDLGSAEQAMRCRRPTRRSILASSTAPIPLTRG